MPLLEAVRVLLLATVSFFAALGLTPFVRRLLEKYGVKKQIREAAAAPVYAALHAKKAGTPTMAGIIIWGTVLGLAILIGVLARFFGGFWEYLNFISRAETYLPIAAMAFAALVGLSDDILGVLRIGPKGGGVSIKQRLFVYFAMSLIGALWFYFRLDWDVLYVPFIGNVVIGWWYIPLFVLVVTATAHSANLTDGLDGLLGGVMLFAFVALTTVAFSLGRYDLATFGGITAGALLAFLWFNIFPAQFMMGDTGATALGITLGVSAMLTNTTLLLPFFAAILVLESGSVIIQLASKKFRGKKVFLSAPIHHHFEAKGWPESTVTMRFWIVSAVFTVLGLALFFVGKYL